MEKVTEEQDHADSFSFRKLLRSILTKRLVPEVPVPVSPEYKPDGSFLLHAEVDGNKVEYNSNMEYATTFAPSPVITKSINKGLYDALGRKGEGNGIIITGKGGKRMVMLHDPEYGIFSVVIAEPDGRQRGVISNFGKVQTMGLGTNAGHELISKSRSIYRRLTRLLEVKTHNRFPRNKRSLISCANSVYVILWLLRTKVGNFHSSDLSRYFSKLVFSHGF